ncbi:protein of unknown function [Methylorubrum extorquens]|uniref:PAS fold-4 domain-containing protein n=1 Tax=Methylorubrum extorquens TaxID=408 RepID=A0A2N9AZ18_METEX|nr:protein of unknown function [Methylorubrum extorquens]
MADTARGSSPAAGAPCGPAEKNAPMEAFAAAERLKVGDLTVEVCRSSASALRSWREQVYLVAGVEAVLLAVAALAVPAIGRRRVRNLRQQIGLRGLVAGSSDVQFIIAAKPDGRFILEALTFTRSGELGRMSARLVGRTTREFFASEDVDLIEADYRSVLASGQTRRTERRVRLGGDEFTWSTVLVPLTDAGGRGGYIFGAATELAGVRGRRDGGRAAPLHRGRPAPRGCRAPSHRARASRHDRAEPDRCGIRTWSRRARFDRSVPAGQHRPVARAVAGRCERERTAHLGLRPSSGPPRRGRTGCRVANAGRGLRETHRRARSHHGRGRAGRAALAS